MKELVKGKGIYIWKLHRIGPMKDVINNVKRAGMTHIIPKIADGNYSYVENEPYLKELITLAHNEGIKVVPYQFVYGTYPKSEAVRIVQELKKYPYDGLVVNAEVAYRDLPNSDGAAKFYCEEVRKSYPDLPLYLSTFRFPSYHRGFPFATFLKYMDGNMPQVYWMKSNGTVPTQLKQTIAEYSKITDVPMIPTGAAFKEWGWAALPEDQKIFVEEVKKNGLQGCNWWEYYYAFITMPQLGQAIIDSPFEVDDPEPPQPPQPPEPPTIPEDKVLFRAECVTTELSVRETPNYPDGKYLRSLYKGDIVNVYEQRDNDGIHWFRIGTNEWCSGFPQYMKVLDEPTPPEPPEEELTYEQMVDRLWDAHPELH